MIEDATQWSTESRRASVATNGSKSTWVVLFEIQCVNSYSLEYHEATLDWVLSK